MSQSVSRRTLIGIGGAMALAPIVADSSIVQAAPAATLSGPLYVLVESVRVLDTRTALVNSGGGRLVAGKSVGIPFGLVVNTVSGGAHSPAVVMINVTVTDTLGGGFLVVRPSDATGTKPLPATSNVNWTTAGQTLANLVYSAVGDETYVEIHAGGNGSTHLTVDLQAYIPVAT